jgi:hypothetical protein
MYVNPNHTARMSEMLDRVHAGTFDEVDIQGLLLGAREYSSFVQEQARCVGADKELLSQPGLRGLELLSDVADSIAHPEARHQGLLRTYLRNTDRQMASSFKRMSRHRFLGFEQSPGADTGTFHIALPPGIKVLSTYDLTSAFFLMVSELVPWEIDIERVAQFADDIQLCLFTILHLTQLPDLDPEDIDSKRYGYLALQSWAGRFHVYAGVLDSIYARAMGCKRPTEVTLRDRISIFPVLNGEKSCDGFPHLDARAPRLWAARRDSQGALRLFELEDPALRRKGMT